MAETSDDSLALGTIFTTFSEFDTLFKEFQWRFKYVDLFVTKRVTIKGSRANRRNCLKHGGTNPFSCSTNTMVTTSLVVMDIGTPSK